MEVLCVDDHLGRITGMLGALSAYINVVVPVMAT